jgi:dTDP-4-dehydrorhamnose reductase
MRKIKPDEILSRTLITGADGMLGSYVDFGIKTNKRSLDITDIDETLSVIQKHKPLVILHLAAETNVERCERNPGYAYLVNSLGTYNIATAAKKVGAKLVYVSTSAVFNGQKKSLYKENDECDPQSYYGRSKYLGEVIVKGMLKDYIIARTCWLFGGGEEKDQKFVAKIIKQIQNPKTEEIVAVEDGLGSPTYGKDIIEAIKRLITEDEAGIFHLVNKGAVSRYEVVKKIVEIMNSSLSVKPVNYKYFNLKSAVPNNEAMKPTINSMRVWHKALEDYISGEWLDNVGKK